MLLKRHKVNRCLTLLHSAECHRGCLAVSLSEVLIVGLSAVQELSKVFEEFHADCNVYCWWGGTQPVSDLSYLITETLLAPVCWDIETMGASFLAET